MGHLACKGFSSLKTANTLIGLSFLCAGDVLILGKNNVYRFNHPRQAAELREKRKVRLFHSLSIHFLYSTDNFVCNKLEF